jgi:hypothetical protein
MNCVPTGCSCPPDTTVLDERGLQVDYHAPIRHTKSSGIENLFCVLLLRLGPADREMTGVPLRSITAFTWKSMGLLIATGIAQSV